MKKLLIALATLLLPALAFAAVTPASGTDGLFCADHTGIGEDLYAPGAYGTDVSNIYCTVAGVGTCPSAGLHCDVSTGAKGVWTIHNYIDNTDSTYNFIAQVLNDIISASVNTFNATTGFSPTDVLGWTTTNLINLFIGSGLALLYNLRGWIVALVVIGAIVYFAYRAFRFFRH